MVQLEDVVIGVVFDVVLMVVLDMLDVVVLRVVLGVV